MLIICFVSTSFITAFMHLLFNVISGLIDANRFTWNILIFLSSLAKWFAVYICVDGITTSQLKHAKWKVDRKRIECEINGTTRKEIEINLFVEVRESIERSAARVPWRLILRCQTCMIASERRLLEKSIFQTWHDLSGRENRFSPFSFVRW